MVQFWQPQLPFLYNNLTFFCMCIIHKSQKVTNVCLKSFFNKQNLIQQWTVMTSVKEWTLLFDVNTQVAYT